MSWYGKVFKPRKIELPNGKVSLEPRSPVIPITILVAIVTWIAIDVTGFNLDTIMRRGYQFFVILNNMFPPNLNYTSHVWGPLIDTIKMSLLGTILGAVVAIPFAIIASTNIVKNPIIIAIARLFISLLRTIPTLVIALIATYVLGLGTAAGTTAIALFTFSFVGKLLYEQIETVDMGAFEAMESIGANKTQAFVVSIVPEILPRYFSNTLFCFEGNVRHAAILGYVGAGGIGLIFNEQLAWREYENVGMILTLLFLTVFVIETTSRYIRSKLV